MPKPGKNSKNSHVLNVFVSYELKSQLVQQADHYDCTMTDVVRLLLKIGLPILEGLSKARQTMSQEHFSLLRRAR